MKQTVVDLRRLPKPDVVEALDFASIKREILEDFKSRYGAEFEFLESDPAAKILETYAYREMLLRARINDAARATMPAFARGGDLDHVALRSGFTRGEGEPDESLLNRFLAGPDLESAAGSQIGYAAHARAVQLSGGGYPLDANAVLVGPASVAIYVLFDPKASVEVRAADLKLVAKALDRVRALTDRLEVAEATIKRFRLKARLQVPYGADWAMVRGQAEASLRQLFRQRFRVGVSLDLSALHAAIHKDNDVTRVEVLDPAGGLSVEASEAPYLDDRTPDPIRLELAG